MKKIAILGHQEVTKILAEKLLDHGFNPVIISLGADKAKNISEYVHLKNYCENKSLSYFALEDYSLKSEECTIFFSQNCFDYVFVVGWSRLIPETILNCSKAKFIGWHGGPFAPPRCRGRAVVNWSILNNETDFFVYTMILKPGVDDGDIIDIKSVAISPSETARSLYIKCAFELSEVLPNYLSDGFVFNTMEQSNETATFLPKRSPSDGEIDWTLPANAIERLIRALSYPFPSAWSSIDGEMILIKRGKSLDYVANTDFKNGLIHHVTEANELVVCTGRGYLLVEEYESVNKTQLKRGDLFQMSGNSTNPTINY